VHRKTRKAYEEIEFINGVNPSSDLGFSMKNLSINSQHQRELISL